MGQGHPDRSDSSLLTNALCFVTRIVSREGDGALRPRPRPPRVQAQLGARRGRIVLPRDHDERIGAQLLAQLDDARVVDPGLLARDDDGLGPERLLRRAAERLRALAVGSAQRDHDDDDERRGHGGYRAAQSHTCEHKTPRALPVVSAQPEL